MGTTGQTKFKAALSGDIQVLRKDDGRFVVWGPASVEVVDKENDLIHVEALEKALPQLLRRKRISLKHSDQLVGDILEGFETDEPKTVSFDGQTVERTEFPTAVLTPEADGVAEKGLYVAAEVWDDTRQARDTREKIERGEYDSYSISGEAISTITRVDGEDMVDHIKEMDLSAVTICESGMNQKAKFGIVSKLGTDSSPTRAVAKEDTMPDDDSQVQAFREALNKELPAGDLATKGYIEEKVKEEVEAALEAAESTEKEEETEKDCGEESVAEAAPEPGEVSEKGDDEEVSEKDLDNPDAQAALQTLAEAYGIDEAELANVVESLDEPEMGDVPGGSEGDDEKVDDVPEDVDDDGLPDADEQPDVEVDDGEEATDPPVDEEEVGEEEYDDDDDDDDVLELLAEKEVPADVIEQVSDAITAKDEPEETTEKADETEEAEEVDAPEVEKSGPSVDYSGEVIGESLEKISADVTVAADEEAKRSFEQDMEVAKSTGEMGGDDEPALNAFYNSVAN